MQGGYLEGAEHGSRCAARRYGSKGNRWSLAGQTETRGQPRRDGKPRQEAPTSLRRSPRGDRWRYNVWRETPSSLHSAAMFVSRVPIAAIASRIFAGVIFGLRPPVLPRARAEASPARVRSEISSRSNSASA